MKVLLSLLTSFSVIGLGFLIFETSLLPLYKQEQDSNSSLQFVEHFSFEERKDAFITKIQKLLPNTIHVVTQSGSKLTSSGTILNE